LKAENLCADSAEVVITAENPAKRQYLVP